MRVSTGAPPSHARSQSPPGIVDRVLDDLLATCTVDRSTADARAAACAEAQYGLLTYGQACRAGISDTALARRLAAGRWRRVRTGVYVIGGAPPLWRQQVLAAVLAVDELAASGRPLGAEPGWGSHALAAGATAAYLLGLPGAARPPRPQVAVAAPWRVRLEDVDGVQLGDLRGEDRDRAHGIPCLSPVRAALEVVQGLHGEVAVTGFVDDLLCSGVERTDLHRRAAQLWPGRRHVALVRKLTAPGAEDLFRSRLERDAVAALDRAGVPARRVNAVVHDRGGARIREVDLLWPEAQLVVELDGLRFHSSAAQRARDRATDRRLVTAGFRVLRYGWRDVQAEPAAMCAEIAAALRWAA